MRANHFTKAVLLPTIAPQSIEILCISMDCDCLCGQKTVLVFGMARKCAVAMLPASLPLLAVTQVRRHNISPLSPTNVLAGEALIVDNITHNCDSILERAWG